MIQECANDGCRWYEGPPLDWTYWAQGPPHTTTPKQPDPSMGECGMIDLVRRCVWCERVGGMQVQTGMHAHMCTQALGGACERSRGVRPRPNMVVCGAWGWMGDAPAHAASTIAAPWLLLGSHCVEPGPGSCFCPSRLFSSLLNKTK